MMNKSLTAIGQISAVTLILLIVSIFPKNAAHLLRSPFAAVEEFRQTTWNRILDTFGDDIQKLFFYGTWFVFFGFYWFVGTIYTLLDVYNKPDALRRYKVQPGTNEPVDTKRLLEVIGLVLFNQTVVSIPVIYLAAKFVVWYGTPDVRELPSIPLAILQIIGCVFIEEIGFYYSHRLLHHKSIYKFIHKKHHEWTAPIAVVAIYAHPLEHVVSNLLPPFFGVLLLRCHVTTAWTWFALAITFTLGEHSGYHLPFFPSPEAHDYHHFKFNNCFGVLGLLDNLHGTNKQFRAAVNYDRHRFLTCLKSMHELYPEKRKNKVN
ncbi:UNVERIFIED_CONTAM: hypothetical protein PYX00_000245 [Menopon gallinae]|uniref:Fatty acid hydroxylase domain-containing protein n=1 Tax=Menopon gallinae TaxID=328185 RepID=A0AAW2I9R2_9NEOP